MFLKRIEVKGFKSFADKVELELDKGITGVVGPNGSGKSNISDAVRWVLGEQSAKNLRGTRMEDVIFTGTDLRKPLGFAEVTITIDNADGMLPVEYSEITVTRRMYRSGESEYYLNRTGCRLKDITELFMDTGVGRDGYSIIGQGRIDEILNAKAEERRDIFEEAAGIVKYKVRKQESERKLDATEQNIIRINDIVSELEIQLEPLNEQASKARRYLDIREKLKILELNLFIKNIDKVKDKLSKLDESYSNLDNELLDNNRKNARLEDDYIKIKTNISDNDCSIESLQNEIYLSNNDMERFQGEANVLNEKILNIHKDISRLTEEIDKEDFNIERLNELLEGNKQNLNSFINSLDEQQYLLTQKNTELNDINSGINEKESKIENMKTEVIELLNSTANKKSSINSLYIFKNGIEKRKLQIDSENMEKHKKIDELEKSLSALKDSIKLFEQSYEDIEQKILEQNKYKADIQNSKISIEKDIFELNGKIQSKKARYRVLNEMENDFEGYNKSVKEIMKLKKGGNSEYTGVCGIVADLIHAPGQYEIAIEAALGSALQNIVTEDEFITKRCIEFLKQNKFGRATFLPLSTVIGRNSYNNEKNIQSSTGFIGFANEVIKYDSKYKNIISNLLGRVVLVDNIDNGIITARKTGYSVKIVTLEGEIISPGGAFTGGSINQNTAGRILGRKRQIADLSSELKDLVDSLDNLNSSKKEIDSRLNSLEDVIKKSIEDKHLFEIKLSSINNSLNSVISDIERNKSDINSLNTELYQIDLENGEIENKIMEESESLISLEKKNSSLTEKIQYEQTGIKDTLLYKDNLVSEITALKVKLAEYKQSIMLINDKIKETEDSIERCNKSIQQRVDEKNKNDDEINRISLSIRNIETSITNITIKKEKSKKLLDSLNEKKKINMTILDGMEEKSKEFNKSSSVLQDEMHKLEMQRARLDMELENLQNRIWEDYEVSYAMAQKYRIEIESINQSSKEINTIKEEIKALGNVNVGAIEEYKRVKERYEFLLKQELDLDEAKNSLQKLILEMTEKMEIQFTKNFSVINENFNITFQQLFGGGKAGLVLCNQEDILSSGVDIIAQPPGKKLQSLTLLSGGEKALTAIALLFAILKMKPSPFCILDEIEAALDDVNVSRYATFLRELSKYTQFIIVTHRKGTMEISDALYGITMEEKGVSRLVSVRLAERVS